jgi:hypothetical protein
MLVEVLRATAYTHKLGDEVVRGATKPTGAEPVGCAGVGCGGDRAGAKSLNQSGASRSDKLSDSGWGALLRMGGEGRDEFVSDYAAHLHCAWPHDPTHPGTVGMPTSSRSVAGAGTGSIP